jgi:hypothetical protein
MWIAGCLLELVRLLADACAGCSSWYTSYVRACAACWVDRVKGSNRLLVHVLVAVGVVYGTQEAEVRSTGVAKSWFDYVSCLLVHMLAELHVKACSESLIVICVSDAIGATRHACCAVPSSINDMHTTTNNTVAASLKLAAGQGSSQDAHNTEVTRHKCHDSPRCGGSAGSGKLVCAAECCVEVAAPATAQAWVGCGASAAACRTAAAAAMQCHSAGIPGILWLSWWCQQHCHAGLEALAWYTAGVKLLSLKC